MSMFYLQNIAYKEQKESKKTDKNVEENDKK